MRAWRPSRSEALTAANGEEALRILGRQEGRIHLVVLDQTMPGLSGRQILAQIRRIDPTIRVVLSSGYSEGGWPSDSEGPEPDAFLGKPYRVRELLSLVAGLTSGGAAS